MLKEKPKSQSTSRAVSSLVGRSAMRMPARPTTKNASVCCEAQPLEANLTKIGLNAEQNVFADWKRTPLEAIGGPWNDQEADKQELNAPYHYTVVEVRRNATPEDLAELQLLEDRLFALTQALPDELQYVVPFARRAWRRDPTPSEVAMLTTLYRDAARAKASYDSAMKSPMLSVLMSPHYLYRSPADLSSRLSFFLWCSIPDDELLKADLTRPEVLTAQARRMLKDPRAASLATQFAAQVWGFDDFENFTGPDEKRFPEFTSQRRREMLDEVTAALDRVFIHGEPLTRLLDEDTSRQSLFSHQDLAAAAHQSVQRGA
ncbi:MAG: DUF1592 domain-containing protein [Akkermansiaceae bacterium]|nr:DUF1592 domain-containing protein [Akkermansiaceae bacterium]